MTRDELESLLIQHETATSNATRYAINQQWGQYDDASEVVIEVRNEILNKLFPPPPDADGDGE